MNKRAGPALYEKMRAQQYSQRAPVVETSTTDEPEARAPSQPLWAWLAPGRSIRLPVGYLLAIAAGVILLVVLAYTAGYQRGGGAERRARTAGEPALPGTTPPEAVMRDTLVTDRNNQGTPRTTNPGTSASPTGGQQAVAPVQWPPVTTDPRQIDLNYFVLSETTKEGAIRLAEFCRTQGLETYAILGKNNRSRYIVIALPGFKAGERTSPIVKEFEQAIFRVGEAWKNSRKGESDFGGSYPRRYDGSW